MPRPFPPPQSHCTLPSLRALRHSIQGRSPPPRCRPPPSSPSSQRSTRLHADTKTPPANCRSMLRYTPPAGAAGAAQAQRPSTRGHQWQRSRRRSGGWWTANWRRTSPAARAPKHGARRPVLNTLAHCLACLHGGSFQVLKPAVCWWHRVVEQLLSIHPAAARTRDMQVSRHSRDTADNGSLTDKAR